MFTAQSWMQSGDELRKVSIDQPVYIFAQSMRVGAVTINERTRPGREFRSSLIRFTPASGKTYRVTIAPPSWAIDLVDTSTGAAPSSLERLPVPEGCQLQ
jgi:hypothetical protein